MKDLLWNSSQRKCYSHCLVYNGPFCWPETLGMPSSLTILLHSRYVMIGGSVPPDHTADKHTAMWMWSDLSDLRACVLTTFLLFSVPPGLTRPRRATDPERVLPPDTPEPGPAQARSSPRARHNLLGGKRPPSPRFNLHWQDQP